jgi:AmmeMemoRadiSam system protein A
VGTQLQNPDIPVLTDAEKRTLLRMARETLTGYLKSGRMPAYSVTEPGLLQKAAAFVTLRRRDGDLQGCIGRLDDAEPLYRTVQECAVSAATRDFRFTPLRHVEQLNDLVIEISALSPFRRISDVQEIEVGRHGLLIRKGFNCGLLLPQVASERSWSRDEFLRAICMKAGLPPNAWQQAELSVFTAEVFEEED